MPSGFTVEFEGLESIMTGFDELERAINEEVKQAVIDCTEDLGKVSVQLSPLLEGDLAGSYSLEVKPDNNTYKGQVKFNTPYALRRHEEPYSSRKPYMEYDKSGRPVGKIINGRGPLTRSKSSVDGMEPGRKYLERPIKKYEGKYQKYIANAVRRVLF